MCSSLIEVSDLQNHDDRGDHYSTSSIKQCCRQVLAGPHASTGISEVPLNLQTEHFYCVI